MNHLAPSPASSFLKHKIEHTDSREFRPDMDDHDDCHSQGHNMYHICSSLENNGIRNLDISRIAIREDSSCPGQLRLWPNQGAHGKRCLSTYRIEITEAHGVQSRSTRTSGGESGGTAGLWTGERGCLFDREWRTASGAVG